MPYYAWDIRPSRKSIVNEARLHVRRHLNTHFGLYDPLFNHTGARPPLTPVQKKAISEMFLRIQPAMRDVAKAAIKLGQVY